MAAQTRIGPIILKLIPKNALEMAIWMESDRMGYLTNTVTKTSLANQQNVVQNEKTRECGQCGLWI